MKINMGNHRGYKKIILLLLISFCSSGGIDESKLATDAEMIWCISKKEYISAGSALIYFNDDSVSWDDGKSEYGGVTFKGEEAIKAKELYRNLVAVIEYYEFTGTEQGAHTGAYDKRDYLESIETTESRNNAIRLIAEWPSYKTDYNNKLENNDLNNRIISDYVNAYSICKLWYDSSR